METLLLIFILSVFAFLVFLNLYVRVKVWQSYRKLVAAKVEFEAKHVFSKQKMETEVLSKYPEHREVLLQFSRNIRLTVNMVSVFMALITLFGAVLLYYRST